MNFLSSYTPVDKNLIEDGVDVDFGHGFFVQVRHTSSKKVSAVRTQKLQQLKMLGRNKELTPEQIKELTKHVAAYGGIVTWHGNGAPAFTPEMALEAFDKRPEFLEDVVTAMASYETFREEAIEEAAGN